MSTDTRPAKVPTKALAAGQTVNRFRADWTVQSVEQVPGGHRVYLVRIADGFRYDVGTTGATRWTVK